MLDVLYLVRYSRFAIIKLGLSLLQRNSDVPSFCSFGRSFFVSRGQNLDGKICDQATDVSVMR